jgi:hypothetical protein
VRPDRYSEGTVSKLVNKAVNEDGQFTPPERRTFGAGKTMPLKDLRRRCSPTIAAPNCPRLHAPCEIIPNRG